MKKTITLIELALFALVLLTGCMKNRYDQKAGIEAQWPKESTGTNGLVASYSFNTNGQLTNITLSVTNAISVALLDASDLKSTSLFSESEFDAVGSRQGMLDNNAGIDAAAKTKAQELTDALSEVRATLQELKGIPSGKKD